MPLQQPQSPSSPPRIRVSDRGRSLGRVRGRGLAAAASIGLGSGIGKAAQAAPAPALEPSLVNAEFNTQLSTLSQEADDFAERASHTQERVDLEQQRLEEQK
ncbi:hypothetical protein ADL35_32920 [Streptomyces sp. NRRL WC-3753]|nr:hypothetical protein ADL35_32920 [Streptomyces sp. NRRL WC-3753]